MDIVDDYFETLDVTEYEVAHEELHTYVDSSAVIMSVENASTFFNIDNPADIHEDDATGVYTGLKSTESDDVLVYNSEQLEQMGVNSGDGLDLIMTHEGAHRALQNLQVNFDSHQEELCCDYLSGVRAGLYNMDTSTMENSLSDTPESISHPNGESRVAAIEHGKQFAQEYYSNHGHAPTLEECVQYFQQESYDANSDVSLREDNTFIAYEDNTGLDNDIIDDGNVYNDLFGIENHNESFVEEHNDFKGLINDKTYHLDKAQKDKEWAEWHEKREKEAIARGDIKTAKEHSSSASLYRKSEKDHIKSSERCTK